MTPEEYRRARSLFLAACRLPAERRLRFLEEACPDEPLVLKEVEALLRHDGALSSSEDLGGNPPCPGPEVPLPLGPGLSDLHDTSFGHFRLRGVIGEGGMGVVLEAVNLKLDRPVALKLIRPERLHDPLSLELFLREARAAARLSHPNVVTIYSVGDVSGQHYIEMELVRGRNLQEILDSEGPLPLQPALEILRQVLCAVGEAHGLQIIHRDLKPANILIADSGQVKISDFGLAKNIAPGARGGGSLSGPLLGTPLCMPPEQAAGLAVDQRSDIYAIGCTFFFMLTGHFPFEGDSLQSVLAKHRSAPPPSLQAFVSHAPSHLDGILQRCLAKEPARRPGSCTQILRDLSLLEAPAAGVPPPLGEAPATIFGRSAELAELERALSALFLGKPGVAIVRGEAGVGKTALLDAVAERASIGGARVLRGTTLRHSGEPLRIVRSTVLDFLGLKEVEASSPGGEARIRCALAEAGRLDEETIQFVARFLATGSFDDSDALIRRARWFRLFAALARDVPLVLIFENMHWTDFETVDVLHDLAYRIHDARLPVLICASCRQPVWSPEESRTSDYFGSKFAEFSQIREFSRVLDVCPLTPEDTALLVDWRLPGNPFATLHPWFHETIYRISKGNPFFALEILDFLERPPVGGGARAIVREADSWRLSDHVTEAWITSAVPPQVQNVVRTRLLPLSGAQAQLLELCALVGDEFDLSILRKVLPSAEHLEEDLDALEELGLVRATSRDFEKFEFTSSLLRIVVEQDASSREKRRAARLHRAIAEGILATLPHAGPGVAALKVADHWRKAGCGGEAFGHYLQGLESLVENNLIRDSLAHLERCREILEGGLQVAPRDLIKYFQLQARAFVGGGKLEAALEALQRAESASRELSDVSLLGQTSTRLGEVHYLRGKHGEAKVAFLQALEAFRSLGDERRVGEAENALGILLQAEGRHEESEERYGKALDLRRAVGDARGICGTLINEGNLHTHAGRDADALSCFEEALSLAERHRWELLECAARTGIANVHLIRGDLEDALAAYRRSLRTYRTLGYRVGEAGILANMGQVLNGLGEFSEASSCLEASLEIRRKLGHRQGEANSHYYLGWVDFFRGKTSRSEERFLESLRIREEIADKLGKAESLCALGQVALLRGEAAAAESRLRQALDLLEPHPRLLLHGEAHAALAEALMERGDVEERQEEIQGHIDEADATAGRCAQPRLRALALSSRSRLLLLLGRKEEALSVSKEAVSLAMAVLPPAERDKHRCRHCEILSAADPEAGNCYRRELLDTLSLRLERLRDSGGGRDLVENLPWNSTLMLGAGGRARP